MFMFPSERLKVGKDIEITLKPATRKLQEDRRNAKTNCLKDL